MYVFSSYPHLHTNCSVESWMTSLCKSSITKLFLTILIVILKHLLFRLKFEWIWIWHCIYNINNYIEISILTGQMHPAILIVKDVACAYQLFNNNFTKRILKILSNNRSNKRKLCRHFCYRCSLILYTLTYSITHVGT